VTTCSTALGSRITARLHQSHNMPFGHMELFLTEECNHRCDYCFVREKDRSRNMPEAIARRAVELLLRDGRRSPRSEIMFFGGEPLLRFPLLARLVEFARERAVAALSL